MCRELILVKVEARKEERPAINAVVDIFRAKIVDVADTSMMIELTGNQAKLDAFIKLIEGYRDHRTGSDGNLRTDQRLCRLMQALKL